MAWADGDECEKHELAFCASCKPGAKPSPVEQTGPRFRRVGQSRDQQETYRIVAKFDGRCEACGHSILAGEDEIRRNDDNQWVHVDCYQ